MTYQNYDWKEKLQQELLQDRLRLALTYVSIILVCYILGMIILMTHYVNQVCLLQQTQISGVESGINW